MITVKTGPSDPFQITTPGFESVDHSKQFLFSCGVFALSGEEFSAFVGEGSAILKQDCV